MRCPSCGFENPAGMKFCGQCATPLTGPCPTCGFADPPGLAFCGQCATPLHRGTLDGRPIARDVHTRPPGREESSRPRPPWKVSA